MKLSTLCYIEKDNSYLMLHRIKKKADINAGKWIGVGGRIEQNETPDECILRETLEETGLTLTSYRMRGIITFINDTCESELIFLFTSDGFDGELIECNEGELRWIPKDQIKTLPLWEGDKAFLDLLLNDEERFFSMKLSYHGEELVGTEVNYH